MYTYTQSQLCTVKTFLIWSDVRSPGAANPSGKSNWVIEIPLAAMAADKSLQKEPRAVWTCVSSSGGSITIIAITVSFVDQSSSRGLEKFGENIPTSSEVIGAHTLNFKPNFKFSSSFFGGTPVPVWVCVSKSSAISSAYKNLRAHHPVRAEI